MSPNASRTAGPRPAYIERPTRRSQKTRLALVQAARDLLEEGGIASLTVNAVTTRADVAHGTFYHHFPSTEALLAAGIGDSMREFSEAMERGFADADDKAWVFVASMAGTFRMLVAHPALAWMLERPQLLAAALHDVCGPFAQRDLLAMVAAGDVSEAMLEHAGVYWEWIIVGALVDASRRPSAKRRIEARLVALVLRMLALPDSRIAALLERLDEEPPLPPRRKGSRS